MISPPRPTGLTRSATMLTMTATDDMRFVHPLESVRAVGLGPEDRFGLLYLAWRR